jgi:hypothetical protein
MNESARLFKIDFSANLGAFEIINALWKRFFTDSTPLSEATSSYWQHYGASTQVHPEPGTKNYYLGGLYAGDYVNTNHMSKLERITNLHIRFVSRALLSILSPEWQKAVAYISSQTGRIINPDFIRIAKSLQSLEKAIGPLGGKKIVVIGDGFGTCGSLIKFVFPMASILYINLGKSLAFDVSFSFKAFPNSLHLDAKDNAYFAEGSFTYLPAEDVRAVALGADVYIALETFQEMDLKVINRYFRIMRLESISPILYSANRVSKTLPDGSVINNKDYGWVPGDSIILKSSPWWLNWGVRRKPPFLFHMHGKVEECIAAIKTLR